MIRVPFQINSQGKLVSGIIHIPQIQYEAPKIVIMCYGLNGTRVEQHRMSVLLGELCEKNGINLLRFDYANCGVNDGDIFFSTQKERIQNVVDVIDFVKNCFHCQTEIYLIGFCDGAKIAVKAKKTSSDIKGIVLWNPQIFSNSPEKNNRKSTHTKFLLHPKYKQPCLEYVGISLNLKYFQEVKYDTSLTLIDESDLVYGIFAENDIRSQEAKYRLHELSINNSCIKTDIIKNADHLFTKTKYVDEVLNKTIAWIKN